MFVGKTTGNACTTFQYLTDDGSCDPTGRARSSQGLAADDASSYERRRVQRRLQPMISLLPTLRAVDTEGQRGRAHCKKHREPEKVQTQNFSTRCSLVLLMKTPGLFTTINIAPRYHKYYKPHAIGLDMLRSALITASGTTCDVRGFVADALPATLTPSVPADPEYDTSCLIEVSTGSAMSFTRVLSSPPSIPPVVRASKARMLLFLG